MNAKSYIDEIDAAKAIIEFVNDADLDDLAAMYSRFCTDGTVVVTSDYNGNRTVQVNDKK
jgi:hypothetical protein